MTTPQTYDFIIAGGGAAGLSLALHLLDSPLRQRSILIVDKEAKDRNDRTWAFWSDRPSLYESIIQRSWEQLHIVANGQEQRIALDSYRYQVIQGLDFYRFAQAALSRHPNVTCLKGVVRGIQDGEKRARLRLDGQDFYGQWVFDSRLRRADLRCEEAAPQNGYQQLKLHFEGWEIETRAPVFDPQAATFLDFRTPQQGAARFFYLLPYDERRALVEYTVFSAAPLHRDEYPLALENYLHTVQGLRSYQVSRRENGCLPASDQPFPRRLGKRVMAIGVKGGRLKPSTGYAFTRIQADSGAIVGSLLRNGHPFAVAPDPARYRLYDSLLLEIMASHGEQIEAIFGEMFARNPIGRILRFLDERGSAWENLQLIATLPPSLFLQTLLRRAARRIDRSPKSQNTPGTFKRK